MIEFKQYAIISDKVINDAKIKYNERLIDRMKHDAKKLWKLINTRLGKNCEKSCRVENLLDNGVRNNCINTSIWPKALKIAEIVPIHKTGTKQDPNNYRAISLISTITKIFDKIIHKRILDFVNKSKIISNGQIALKKKLRKIR